MGATRKQPLGRHRRRRRPGVLGQLTPAAGRGFKAAVRRPAKRVPKPSWKLLGLAGIAGVAATGVVVARKRRAHVDLEPDELRERLHRRLEDAAAAPAQPPAAPRC